MQHAWNYSGTRFSSTENCSFSISWWILSLFLVSKTNFTWIVCMPVLCFVVIIRPIPKEVSGSIKSDSRVMNLLSVSREERCGSDRTLLPFFACQPHTSEYEMLHKRLAMGLKRRNLKQRWKHGDFINHRNFWYKSSGWYKVFLLKTFWGLLALKQHLRHLQRLLTGVSPHSELIVWN